MSSLKRKRNLLDDKQKREIISYAKENQKLTQQQIADNLTIKWDLPIKRRTVGDILNQKEFYESDNEGSPSRKRHRSGHRTWQNCFISKD
jgi:transposase